MAMERLDELRQIKQTLTEKISKHDEAIKGLRERLTEIEKEEFKLDQGRTLEAVKMAAAENPEFAKLLASFREKIELEAAARKPKNARGPKAKSEQEPNSHAIATPRVSGKTAKA